MSMPQPDQGPQTLTAPPGSPHGATQQLPTVQPPPPPPPPPVTKPRAQRRSLPTLPRGVAAAGLLGLLSVLAVVLGLSLREDGRMMWDDVNAWGAVAIAGAVLTLAPAAAHLLRLPEQRAWRVALAGAGLLLLFWVLLVAPVAGSNVTLLATVGVAAGLGAAWFAAPSRRRDVPGSAP